MRWRAWLTGVGALATSALWAAGAVAAPGQLDPSFGEAGIVRLLSGNQIGYLPGIATQPDGKVIVAGARQPGNVAVFRRLPDGTPDPSFGAGGEVVTPLGGSAGAFAPALQEDGKILVAGSVQVGAHTDVLVARYTATGALDPSFGGGDGVAIESLGPEADEARAVAVGPGGRIVAVGTSAKPGSVRVLGILVLRPDGTPDPSFDGDGKLLLSTPDGDGNDGGVAVAVAPDGRIVIGDANGNGGGHGFAVFRLLPSGAPDPSFDGDGLVETPIPVSGLATFAGRIADLALLGDGRIVAAGYGSDYGGSPPNYDGKVAAVRYLPDGSLDRSFAAAGIFMAQLAAGNESARALAVDAEGRYLLAGSYVEQAPTPVDAPFVMRLEPDGTPDPAYGSTGIVLRGKTAPFGEYVDSAALDGAGRLLTLGSAFDGNNVTWTALTRYQGDPPGSGSGPGTVAARLNRSPHARMRKVPARISRSRLKGFRGTASDPDGDGLRRVEVALLWKGVPRPARVRIPARRGAARVSARLRPPRTCLALANLGGRFRSLRASKGSPCPRVWLRARGKARWSLRLKTQLPVGSYVVFARAIDSGGLAERSFSRRAGNRYAFRVTAPSRKLGRSGSGGSPRLPAPR